MSRNIKRTLSMVLALIMICSTMGVMAFAAETVDKVLFVTDTAGIEQLESLSEDELSSYAAIANYDDVNISFSEIARYRAIAFPYELDLVDEIRYAFEHGCIVYLYGELTIRDYKNIVGLEHFEFEINVHDTDGTLRGTAVQSFPADYESTEVFGVISCGDSPLLCTLDYGTDQPSFDRLYKIITKHFAELPRLYSRSATIIRSGANYVTSCSAGDTYMDYMLYRNYNETDPNYDYFAIHTKVWGIGQSIYYADKIVTTHELPWENDELYETSPASKASAGAFTIGVNLGQDSSVNISYSVDLSEWEPKINRSVSFTDDTVTWTMTAKTFLGFQVDDVDNVPLDCMSSFRVNNPGSGLAEVDVTFWGRFGHGDTEISAPQKTVYVCYTYSDT